MVKIRFSPQFKKRFSKIDLQLREKILKQLAKLKDNPELGKPMRHTRKGTWELYIAPYRLSYGYDKKERAIILLDFYHKDEQ
ncbi:MAG: type II toxin-antitoxin system RelE/ParE family toxin [Candidatus Woesearchaeota archaeon]|nr:type II toxin-antitoxin system RelE/ParE family toxin [Candidatus Woesearchaeota archaeon]